MSFENCKIVLKPQYKQECCDDQYFHHKQYNLDDSLNVMNIFIIAVNTIIDNIFSPNIYNCTVNSVNKIKPFPKF